jgi:hypothetical protein
MPKDRNGYIIMRESNGSYSTMGPAVEPFKTFKQADTAAAQLSGQYPAQTFVVVGIMSSHAHIHQRVCQRFAAETTLPKKPEAKNPVVQLYGRTQKG